MLLKPFSVCRECSADDLRSVMLIFTAGWELWSLTVGPQVFESKQGFHMCGKSRELNKLGNKPFPSADKIVQNTL